MNIKLTLTIEETVIEKAKKYLDWEPKIGLEEGLNKTINYFSSLI